MAKNVLNMSYKTTHKQYSGTPESTLTNDSGMLFYNRIWMDSKEAADYLRISIGALRNAVYRKQIIARKFRRRLYFKASELNRLLEISIVR